MMLLCKKALSPHSSLERLPPPPAALLPPIEIERVSSVCSNHTSFPRPQQTSAFDLGPADPQTASYNQQATLKSDKSSLSSSHERTSSPLSSEQRASLIRRSCPYYVCKDIKSLILLLFICSLSDRLTDFQHEEKIAPSPPLRLHTDSTLRLHTHLRKQFEKPFGHQQQQQAGQAYPLPSGKALHGPV